MKNKLTNVKRAFNKLLSSANRIDLAGLLLYEFGLFFLLYISVHLSCADKPGIPLVLLALFFGFIPLVLGILKFASRGKLLLRVFVLVVLSVGTGALLLPNACMDFNMQVVGRSMEPTFAPDQYIDVEMSVQISKLHRGDIVVVANPLKKPTDEDYQAVKRIIGMPNERIRITDGEVFINGEKLNEPYLFTQKRTFSPNDIYWKDFAIPPDHFFVMGDNREHSADSRAWGIVPQKDVLGVVQMDIVPTPTVTRTPALSEKECKEKDGVWTTRQPGGESFCNSPRSDAGKSCTDGSECSSGSCQFDSDVKRLACTKYRLAY